ncbi:MAG: hypothetical protein AAF492_06605, partial [Verrucomicrobiota bacterium]
RICITLFFESPKRLKVSENHFILRFVLTTQRDKVLAFWRLPDEKTWNNVGEVKLFGRAKLHWGLYAHNGVSASEPEPTTARFSNLRFLSAAEQARALRP